MRSGSACRARGEEQLRQSVLNAAPFVPRRPLFRPAIVGRPLRCENVSVQLSVLPVSFAVKRPAAPDAACGAGG